MSRKTAYIEDIMRVVNTLSKYITDRGPELHKMYFDNGYNSGGSDEITDADIQALYPDVTAADFTAGITLIGELNNFTGNQPVTQADYLATLNKLRISGLV